MNSCDYIVDVRGQLFHSPLSTDNVGGGFSLVRATDSVISRVKLPQNLGDRGRRDTFKKRSSIKGHVVTPYDRSNMTANVQKGM